MAVDLAEATQRDRVRGKHQPDLDVCVLPAVLSPSLRLFLSVLSPLGLTDERTVEETAGRDSDADSG